MYTNWQGECSNWSHVGTDMPAETDMPADTGCWGSSKGGELPWGGDETVVIDLPTWGSCTHSKTLTICYTMTLPSLNRDNSPPLKWMQNLMRVLLGVWYYICGLESHGIDCPKHCRRGLKVKSRHISSSVGILFAGLDAVLMALEPVSYAHLKRHIG